MSLAYITHSRCRRHNMGQFHPEQPARLDAINDRLITKQLSLFFNQYDAPKASREQLLRVHDADYLAHLESVSPSDGLAWLDGDTAMCHHPAYNFDDEAIPAGSSWYAGMIEARMPAN